MPVIKRITAPKAITLADPEPKPKDYLSPFAVRLTANLISVVDYFNVPAVGGFLRITLCGFGPVIPHYAGTGMLADAGIPILVGPQQGVTPLSVTLALNTYISPGYTFYEIALLDQNKNVIQCGNYIFDTTGVLDLMDAIQIVPPYGIPLAYLRYQPCAGAIPGATYTAPGNPIAVSYNGLFMPYGAAWPTYSYTNTGNVITLNFLTQSGDRIDALVVA